MKDPKQVCGVLVSFGGFDDIDYWLLLSTIFVSENKMVAFDSFFTVQGNENCFINSIESPFFLRR